MKLKNEKQIDFSSNTVFEGYDAKIDEKNMGKLWDLLQDPYKNPIGAVVREYVSNSFDSHAEASFIKENSLAEIRNEYSIYNDSSDQEILELKKYVSRFDNDAVVVTVGKDETGHFWSTEDFGVGLSTQRVKDVFCSYLKSTKENTNNAIGCFGIGSKSGLSYTDVIHIRTRYNGVEYIYFLRKGETAPRLDLVSKESTSKMNGTQIKIYIKNSKEYSWSNPEPETYKFKDECKKQLAYFDNVYFNNIEGLNNDFQVIQGKNWIKNSSINPFNTMHICLGKVAYPIDWDNLNMEPINLNVALKFEVGELDIIQTREDVKYTPRTKENILNKIEKIKEEFLEKWEEQKYDYSKNLLEFLSLVKKTERVSFNIQSSKIEFYLRELFDEDDCPKYVFKPFEDIGFTDGNLLQKDFCFINFQCPSYVKFTGLVHKNIPVWKALSDFPVYRISGNHDSKKSKYIQSQEGDFYFIRKKEIKVSLREAKQRFYLKNYPVSKWRTILNTINSEVNKTIMSLTSSYSKVEIPKQWIIDNYHNKAKRVKSEGFNFYQFTEVSSYYGTWKPTKLKSNKIKKSKNFTYLVGVKEQKEDLLTLAKIFVRIVNSPKIRLKKEDDSFFKVGYVGKSNLKYFENVENLITMGNFKNHRVYVKFFTAYHIAKVYGTTSNQVKIAICMMKSINPKFYKVAKEVSEYMSYYYPTNSSLIEDVYKMMVEEDKLDNEMIEKAKFVLNYFYDLPGFNFLNLTAMESSDLASIIYRFNKSVPVSKHKKMNPNFYVNLNEEEFKWLGEGEEKEFYKKCRLLNF